MDERCGEGNGVATALAKEVSELEWKLLHIVPVECLVLLLGKACRNRRCAARNRG